MEEKVSYKKYYILIACLSVILVAILSVGVTLAIMAQEKKARGTIKLGENIQIDVTNFNVNGESLVNLDQPLDAEVLPGATLTGLNISAKVAKNDIGADEEVAYIRARITVKLEDVYKDDENGEAKLIDTRGMISLGQDPNGNNSGAYYWELVSFVEEESTEQWWVLMDSTTRKPMVVTNHTTVQFMENGTILVDKSVPNEFAGKQIQISLSLEALQSKNIDADQILSGNEGQPWWNA